MIVECKIDNADPLKIVSTELVTPIYRHDGS
jgi:hypothetical protein